MTSPTTWGLEPQDEGTLASQTTLISLGDAKTFLNYPNPTVASDDDAELTNLVNAACDYIEHQVGPVAPTNYVERFDGWGGIEILLRHSPVISVTYVNEYWSTGGLHALSESTPSNPIDGYQLEKETGRLVRVFQGNWPRTWFPGSRNVEVSYQAGRQPVPPLLQLAACELVAHWWQTDHQARAQGIGGGMTMDADEEPAGAAAGQWIGVPNKVQDKLRMYRVPVLG